MSDESRASATSVLFRLALGLTALSLWVYIPYRYATRSPRFEGFLGAGYATLFPLAAILALAAILVALRPSLLDRLAGSRAGRWALGGYGGLWLAMGVMCIPSLTATTAAAPLKGALATIHMSAQHVFLGLVAIGAAWRPDVVAGVALDRPKAAEPGVGVEETISG